MVKIKNNIIEMFRKIIEIRSHLFEKLKTDTLKPSKMMKISRPLSWHCRRWGSAAQWSWLPPTVQSTTSPAGETYNWYNEYFYQLLMYTISWYIYLPVQLISLKTHCIVLIMFDNIMLSYILTSLFIACLSLMSVTWFSCSNAVTLIRFHAGWG